MWFVDMITDGTSSFSVFTFIKSGRTCWARGTNESFCSTRDWRSSYSSRTNGLSTADLGDTTKQSWFVFFPIEISLSVANDYSLQNMFFLPSIKWQIGLGRVRCGQWLSVRNTCSCSVLCTFNWFWNPRSRLLCRRDDAYGRRQIRPR